MLAIYKKELRSYFTSMIGYVFIAIFMVIIGIYFTIQNLLYGSANIEQTLSGVTFLVALLIPLLTMRLMAEENKQKTDQLLYTSPVTAASIVLGKFLAVFTIYGIVVLTVCTFPLIMRLYGTIPMAAAYSGILGFSLLGAAYLSIGLFISSLTESQVVAAVITFIVSIFTILMDGIAGMLPTSNKAAVVIFAALLLVLCFVIYLMVRNMTITVVTGLIGGAALLSIYYLKPSLLDGSVINVFGWVSVLNRYNSFAYGTLDVASVVYYLSVAFLFVFLTAQMINKKRFS
ncbi:MAG: putative rane protein [Herbinix sp.]|jgi:ABC-2 type transport system permease protein|nr:putative rane protein [Herbinix sp.]